MNGILSKLKSYIRPTDGTWWVGVLTLSSGIMQINGVDIPVVSAIARPILNTYFGGAGPLILAGMGAITLNAKFARGA